MKAFFESVRKLLCHNAILVLLLTATGTNILRNEVRASNPQLLEAMRQDYLKFKLTPQTEAEQRAQIEVRSMVLFGPVSHNVPNEMIPYLEAYRDELYRKRFDRLTASSMKEDEKVPKWYKEALIARLQAYDTNGDGHITFEEEAAVHKRRSDENLVIYLRGESEKLHTRFGDRFFRRFDTDEDGKLDANELAEAAKEITAVERTLGPSFDADKNGTLEGSEVSMLVHETDRVLKNSNKEPLK